MASAHRRSLVQRLFRRRAGASPEDAGRSSALEILIAALLGIAAVLTAFAAFKADLADGDTLKAFQEGSAIYDDANQQYLEGNQQVTNDVNVFTQYVIAVLEDNQELAGEIQNRLMDPALSEATDEWVAAEGEIPSAIEADAYEVEAYARADALTEEGDALFARAEDKDKEGDNFTLATVILAMALFFGGVAGVTRSHTISVAMTFFAAILISGAGVYMLTL